MQNFIPNEDTTEVSMIIINSNIFPLRLFKLLLMMLFQHNLEDFIAKLV